MLVLDADAGLAPDLLERVMPRAEAGGWAAVQLRKAVVNSGVNLLTRAQAMEMALDAVIQEGRLAEGGWRSCAATASCCGVRRCRPAAASTKPP